MDIKEYINNLFKSKKQLELEKIAETVKVKKSKGEATISFTAKYSFGPLKKGWTKDGDNYTINCPSDNVDQIVKDIFWILSRFP